MKIAVIIILATLVGCTDRETPGRAVFGVWVSGEEQGQAETHAELELKPDGMFEWGILSDAGGFGMLAEAFGNAETAPKRGLARM